MIPDFDFADRAKLARLNDVDGFSVMLHAVLLSADLDDAIVLLGRLDQIPAFSDEVAQRLFDVDVLAGLAGGDGDRHVPVGLRRHDHRVDALVGEQFSKVLVGR